jgi:3-hydroxymyristoyl/3-hydroxydecanoyl-(acyl carrier protein) dehydratase
MKLLNSFYEILQITEEEQHIVCRIRFHQSHGIFQAHFPGNPVVPGACIVQIAKELLEKQLNHSLSLTQAVNVKFVHPIQPALVPEVSFDFFKITEINQKYKVSVNVTDGSVIYTKQVLLFERKLSLPSLQNEMETMKVCIVLPTYNSEGLLEEVLRDFLNYTTHILVINDGSTDNTAEILQRFPRIRSITFQKNRGKGFALNRGFDLAEQLGYDYAVTVDSDAQHKAADLQTFLFAISQYPDTLLVGNRGLHKLPLSHGSRFANRFSNFWYWVQTGIHLEDTQTGYRAYPLRVMKGMRAMTNRYEAETEYLVRMAWRGIAVKSVPVHVFYPQFEKRVSHFRPIIDFIRISLLNSILVIFAVIYGYPRMLIRKMT